MITRRDICLAAIAATQQGCRRRDLQQLYLLESMQTRIDRWMRANGYVTVSGFSKGREVWYTITAAGQSYLRSKNIILRKRWCR